jgi:sugar O-acyltransferase (sialic acid O-acetyltransferase NeuD family)
VSDRPLLICGARSFSHDVADVIDDTPGLRVIGFVENEDRERCSEPHGGLPLYWVEEAPREAGFVCALATTHRSRFTGQMEELGFEARTVVHPTTHVSRQSRLGAGTLVLPGVVIAARSELGRHVVVSRGTLVGHHTRIGDHVSLMPGANVAGECRIGLASYIGMGAVVLDGITVGEHAVVGAGAVVTRDVPDRTQVVGVPARVVKEGIDGK